MQSFKNARASFRRDSNGQPRATPASSASWEKRIMGKAHHGKSASWERVVFCCWHNHSVYCNLEQKPIQTRAHLVRRFVAKDGPDPI
jgi:hypothetical protein